MRHVVQAALDRGTAEGTSKLTGVWPGDGADDEAAANGQSDEDAPAEPSTHPN